MIRLVVVQTTMAVRGRFSCTAEDRIDCPLSTGKPADKVRAIADEMFDPRSRETLLRIAKDYESLAKRAQEREAVDFNGSLTAV